jgi:membrane protein
MIQGSKDQKAVVLAQKGFLAQESRSSAMNEGRTGLISRILGLMERIKGDHVGAYAAQAAYFLIMSFIPFVLFLTTLIRYTPLTYNAMRNAIIAFVPQNLQSLVLGIVVDVYRRSTAVVSISALTALWSAGKGLQAMINGLNSIYHVKETRNWLITRLYAVVYMLLFVIAVIVSLLLMVLGTQIQELVSKHVPLFGRIISRIVGARTLLVFFVLFLVFLVLYRVLPNRKATFKSQVPGAMLTAVAWSVFSYGFSFYFEIFPGFSNMYGNLATLIMLMLWLYICMNLMLYGAEINAYFEKEFRQVQESMRDMISHEKESEEK